MQFSPAKILPYTILPYTTGLQSAMNRNSIALYKFAIQILSVMQLYSPGITFINTVYYTVKLAHITIGDDCSVLCASFTFYVHSLTTKLEVHETQ